MWHGTKLQNYWVYLGLLVLQVHLLMTTETRVYMKSATFMGIAGTSVW